MFRQVRYWRLVIAALVAFRGELGVTVFEQQRLTIEDEIGLFNLIPTLVVFPRKAGISVFGQDRLTVCSQMGAFNLIPAFIEFSCIPGVSFQWFSDLVRR